MTDASELDLEYLRQWIGRSEQASDIVTERLVTSLLATLDTRSPDSTQEMRVPLAVHWCLAPSIVPTAQLGPDGHPALGEFLPPVPRARRMWAGGRLEIHDVLRVDDRVTRRSTIRDVTSKQGRTGTLCFVTVDHETSTERGPAIYERQDIVYRRVESSGPACAGSPRTTAEASPSRKTAQHSYAVQADPVLLFRYSAVTFNGHRIHYDSAYCADVEGYPGLVVHGPLQATLLLELAASLRGGRAPRSFHFRSVRPLFSGTDFTVNANEEGDGLQLWTASSEGHPAMRAEARW